MSGRDHLSAVRDFIHGSVTEFQKAQPVQRPLYWAALILGVSFLFHTVVWVFSGESLAGPVSWRKPILFSFTPAVTLAALGWILGRFRKTAQKPWESWTVAIAMLLETGLIVMQKWRGRASHFNNETPADSLIFALMGALILYFALFVLIWTVRAFFSFQGGTAMREAILAGLLLLCFSNLMGIVIVLHGSSALAADPHAVPSQVGSAGNLKFPHGLALHALQILPILAWWIERRGAVAPQALSRVRTGELGYAALVVYAVWQTASGRAAPDPDLIPAIVLGAGIGLLLSAFLRPIPRIPTPATLEAPSGRP